MTEGTESSIEIKFAPVDAPDETARAAARTSRYGAPEGASELGGMPLGNLGELGAFLAGCQGRFPAQAIQRPRVVVFGAEHGIAARGVSAHQEGATAGLIADVRDGRSTLALLAESVGAGIRVIDLGDAGAGERRSSAPIDSADALTRDELLEAVRAGMVAADAEVDEGADLLVAAAVGVGASTAASALVAALTGTEPVAVVGRGSGVDDTAWMRKTAAVRDALRRARPYLAQPLELVRVAGGADLAALAGFLAQAAVRRTPVLLDGLVVAAAAMVAEELAPGSRAWWVAAHRSRDKGQAVALEHLDLEPVFDLDLGGDTGVGALAAVPLVLMAARAQAVAQA